MEKFTKAERAAIDAAWREIRHLCECTNWSDAPAWREAEKLERRETGDTTASRAMICKAWSEGLDNPGQPVREIHWIRPGYLKALLLGVRHACERRGTEYNGPMVERARELCLAAIAANDAHTSRIIGES